MAQRTNWQAIVQGLWVHSPTNENQIWCQFTSRFWISSKVHQSVKQCENEGISRLVVAKNVDVTKI